MKNLLLDKWRAREFAAVEARTVRDAEWLSALRAWKPKGGLSERVFQVLLQEGSDYRMRTMGIIALVQRAIAEDVKKAMAQGEEEKSA